MPEGNEKDLSIDDEQSEEVAGGAKAEALLKEEALRERSVASMEAERPA